ncbi:MAG: hypothetical protein AAGB12_14385 [Pseudomonadota bacterium]
MDGIAIVIPLTKKLHQDGAPVRPKPDTTTYFTHTWYVNGGEKVRCGANSFQGTSKTKLNQWTKRTTVDTDNRPGDCHQSFGIIDPANRLDGLNLSINFKATDKKGEQQCRNTGKCRIPIVSDESFLYPSEHIISADDGPGGCELEFSIKGRSDVVLDIEFFATNTDTDREKNQCGNRGTHKVALNKPVTILYDTDGRRGGCAQRFRLRKL